MKLRDKTAEVKEEREISQVFPGQSQASSLILVDESAVDTFRSRDYAPALKAQGMSESVLLGPLKNSP